MARSARVRNRIHPTDDKLKYRYSPINMFSHQEAKAYESFYQKRW